MIHFFKLVNQVPTVCSQEEWRAEWRWREDALAGGGEDPWRVGYTDIDGEVHVSTVFLDTEHIGGQFETKVFGVDLLATEALVRTRTWAAALAQHDQSVMWAREQIGQKRWED